MVASGGQSGGVGSFVRRCLALSCLATWVAGCAADLVPRVAVPASLVDKASVSEFNQIRYWGDSKPSAYKELAAHRIESIRQAYGDKASKLSGTRDILTLSGGGSDGAFGAGLLIGWTERGDRPHFDYVTGISTGAMMAPLAFLGSKYDPQLKEAYTTLSDDDVASTQIFSAVIGAADSLVDTTPLKGLVAKYMTVEMLREIAEEHRKGRILMIGTTNLDAQRSVVWDIRRSMQEAHPTKNSSGHMRSRRRWYLLSRSSKTASMVSRLRIFLASGVANRNGNGSEAALTR